MGQTDQRQRMEALQRSKAVRNQRKLSKEGIRRGDVDPAAVVLDPPSYWENAKLEQLLRAVPHLGERRTATVCRMARVAPERRLHSLVQRERHYVARILREHLTVASVAPIGRPRRAA